MKRERVWDPLVRLFHCALAAAFVTAWFIRSEAEIHETAGKIVLILVIWRTAWGIIGPGSARFENFVKGPRATLAYAWSIFRGDPAHSAGHNPAGAAMIGLLLAGLALTTASGIMMTTTALWGNAWIEWVHGTAATACVFLIAGHLLGVLIASLQHRELLPLSMITGMKWVKRRTKPYLGTNAFTPRRILVALAIAAFSAATWAGTSAALDASFWRMSRIVASAATENGCEKAEVAGPHVEVFPDVILRYIVNSEELPEPVNVRVNAMDAWAKKPALTIAELQAPCSEVKTARLSHMRTIVDAHLEMPTALLHLASFSLPLRTDTALPHEIANQHVVVAASNPSPATLPEAQVASLDQPPIVVDLPISVKGQAKKHKTVKPAVKVKSFKASKKKRKAKRRGKKSYYAYRPRPKFGGHRDRDNDNHGDDNDHDDDDDHGGSSNSGSSNSGKGGGDD
jgi:cytochrome b